LNSGGVGAVTDDEFERQLATLDIGLFDHVPSETSPRDRTGLLALYNACRDSYDSFTYLEIGSHLGGTLQVLLRDDRCKSIVSIDPRPKAVPDDRGRTIAYPGNTTERMLKHLRAVPGGVLEKLRTIEASTADLVPEDFAGVASICFIDGEHTHESALRDARFCRTAVSEDGAIVFHDRRVVEAAIGDFLLELEDRCNFTAYELPGALFVVEIGMARLIRTPWIPRLERRVPKRPLPRWPFDD
jgi:hypothetical protein